jgi:hypothetical protein
MVGLVARVETLEAENAELRRRLGMNSTNSSTPPSKDSLGAKAARRADRSSRERSKDCKPGGQPGHKGSGLAPTVTPDRTETLRPPAACSDRTSADVGHTVDRIWSLTSGNAAGAGSGRVTTSADRLSAGGGALEVASHLRGRNTGHRVPLAVGHSQVTYRQAGFIRLPWLPREHIYEPTWSGQVTSSDTPQDVCLQVFGSMDHPHVSHQAQCFRSSPHMPTNCGSPVGVRRGSDRCCGCG